MKNFWAWMLDLDTLTVGQFMLRVFAVIGIGLAIVIPIILLIVFVTIAHIWIAFLITLLVLGVSGGIGCVIVAVVSENRHKDSF